MTITNGQVADADEVVEITEINEIYTGSSFDSTTATASPDEQSYELTAVNSVSVANYVLIKITGTSYVHARSDNTYGGKVELKAQIKETGGTYSDIVAYKSILDRQIMRSHGTDEQTSTYEILATLTSGQKTNGFQIKLFSKSTKHASNTDGLITFTNINTTMELKI